MSRPTRIYMNASALFHNVQRVKECAPGKKMIAMVKANAYGCHLSSVLPELDGQVDAFGLASVEEALRLRRLGSRSNCVLFQGIFDAEEWEVVARERFQCVLHNKEQLRWILATSSPNKIKIWVKIDTGMHRLGFDPKEVAEVINALLGCPWIDNNIGLMTHLAHADEPTHPSNDEQLRAFQSLVLPEATYTRSIANSAAILSFPEAHADVVRPGIMLYGVSPFAHQIGTELGLMPVIRFVSAVSAIHHYPAHAKIGYGGIWESSEPSVIGVVAVGYGDGYPRHIKMNTPTWVNGFISPIVGRVSMDTLTIDLTRCPGVKIGDVVELWGQHIPIETVAKSAGTIAYELLCQMSIRVPFII